MRCAIASSPPRFCHRELLDCEAGESFRASYARANALQAAGEPDGLLSATVPTFNLFTARTYLDKYGEHDRYDCLRLLPDGKTPLLVTLGGDERDAQYAELARSGGTRMQSLPGGAFALIPGANHFYTGRSDELWQAVSGWLAGLAR